MPDFRGSPSPSAAHTLWSVLSDRHRHRGQEGLLSPGREMENVLTGEHSPDAQGQGGQRCVSQPEGRNQRRLGECMTFSESDAGGGEPER